MNAAMIATMAKQSGGPRTPPTPLLREVLTVFDAWAYDRRELARLTGIPYSTISSYFNGQYELRASEPDHRAKAEVLLRAMGVDDPSECIDRARAIEDEANRFNLPMFEILLETASDCRKPEAMRETAKSEIWRMVKGLLS